MFRSFVVKMLLGAAAPLCVMLVSGVALYGALQTAVQTGEKLAQEQAVIAAAHNLTLRFLDAETGERGFVITGKDTFLVPYDQALSSFDLIQANLRTLLVGQPDQLARLDEAQRLFEKWNREVAVESIAHRRSGDAPPDIALSEEGRRLVDSFRTLMADFNQHTQQDLQNTQRASILIVSRANQIALIGFGSAVLLALIIWLLLANRTSLAVGGMTQAARRVMDGDLHYRAPVIGHDELASMALAFNQMATRMEEVVRAEQQARLGLSEQVELMVASRTHELVAMNSMVELLQSCQVFDEAVQVTKTLMPALFAGTTGGLLMRMEQGGLLRTTVQWGKQQAYPGHDYTDRDCWAIRRGKPHQCEVLDASQDMVCNHIAPIPGKHLCIPLIAQGMTFGVLHLGVDATQAHDWENRREFATSVTEQLSISLANLRLRESLEQQSVRDPLTGLYNRRYLEATIERELSRALREQAALSVIMLDLDHFKAINDDHGHTAGDRVLVQVAQLLMDHLRGEDLVCRYGGEEFTIILPRADQAVALQRAEELRTLLLALCIEIGTGLEPLAVTASFGIASYPQHAETVEDLLTVADDALYDAKDQGRNRVRVAQLKAS